MPLKVLLLDDEAELVFTLAERLTLRGIEAEGVLTGAEALKRLKEKVFDVIVTDVKMPGIGGLDVMRQIKMEQPQIPVILITGYGSMQNGDTAMKEGAFAYIAKPFQLEDLITKIKAAAAGQANRKTCTRNGSS